MSMISKVDVHVYFYLIQDDAQLLEHPVSSTTI